MTGRTTSEAEGAARRRVGRLLRTAASTLVIVGMFAVGAGSAAAQGGWDVDREGQRQQKIIKRYKKLLEQNPSRGVIFDKLIQYVGRGEGLDRLIEEYEQKVDSNPKSADYRLILGHLLKEKNTYEEALTHYDRAAELAPDRPAVWMSRGSIHRKLQNPEKARDDFERALEQVDKESRKRKLLRKLADIAFQEQSWERAENYYDRLIQLDPRNEYLRQEYARVLVEHRRFEKALKQYEKLIELAGRNTKSKATVLRDMGDLYEKMGKDQKAVETYRRAIGLVRSTNWLHETLRERVIDVYRSNDQLAELLEEYEEKWGRPNYDRALLLARLADEVGREDDALEYLDRAVSLRPREAKPREKRIDIYRRRGADDEVLEEYRKLAKVSPNKAQYRFRLVRVHMRRGNRDKAVEQLERIERNFRRKPNVYQKLAEAYLRYGMEEKALETYKRLVDLQPNNESYILSLGESYYRAGKIEEAVETWKRLLETPMDKGKAYSQLGQVFAEHGMIERSLRNYRKAVEERPEDLSVRRGLAKTYERARRWDKAIEAWRHVKSETDQPSMRSRARDRILGVYQRQHRLRSKLQEFREQFEGNSPDIEAGFFLAGAHMEMSNFDKAAATYRRLAELDATGKQRKIEALEALEKLYRRRGKLEKAVAILRRLAELRPKQQRAYYHQIAELSLKLYENDQAVRYAALAVEKNPKDAEAHARLGDVYRKMNKPDAAIEEYRRAIQLDPKSRQYMMKLAELLRSQGELDRAQELYREVVRKAEDDSLILDSARRAIEIAEQRGNLRELERDFSKLAFGGKNSHAYREVMLELYDRVVTPLMLEMRYGVGAEMEVVEEKLDAIGSRAAPVLSASVAGDDVSQRALAIRLLGGLREETAAIRLARIAVDREDSLRTLAAISVAEIGDPRAAGPLVGALDSDNPDVRRIAVWALGYVGGDEARGALADELAKGQNWEQQSLAAIGLGRIGGEEAARALREALNNIPPGESNSRSLTAVAWALGQVGGDEAVESLTEAARRSPEGVQYVASVALARIGTPKAIRALLKLRWSGRESLKAPAMRGLEAVATRVGSDGDEPSASETAARHASLATDVKYIAERRHEINVAGLVNERGNEARLVESRDRTEAFFTSFADEVAAEAENHLEPGEDRKSDVVRAVLTDLWRNGSLGLGRMEPQGGRATDEYATALGSLGGRLGELLDSDEPAVVATSLALLGRIDATPDADRIRKHLASDSPRVRSAAVRAYGRTNGADSDWEPFERGIEDDRYAVRRATCRALVPLAGRSESAEKRAVEMLGGALDDSYRSVRLAAVRSLGRIGGTRAARALVDRLEDLEMTARVHAVRTLRSMEAEPARQAIERLREHTDYRLRRAARGDD